MKAVHIMLLTTLTVATACGPNEDFDPKRSQTGDVDVLGEAPSARNGSAGEADATAVTSAPAADTSHAGVPSVPSSPGQGAASETGLAYYTRAILPVLQAQCVSCHADPRVKVETRGPLSIYSYTSMRVLLDEGTGPQDNALLDKILNLDAHTGGNRCAQGLATSPCKEVKAWWTIEFGDGVADGSGSPGGKISEISPLGRVYGWAYDPDDAAVQVAVNFYVDGPAGIGTPVGTTVANRSGADGNSPGDHAFVHDLPEAFRDGKAHKLYAYAAVDGQEVQVGDGAVDFTAYSFTTAGRTFYEANVRGQLASCQGCHVISYEQQFYSLLAPSPALGGTATNNQLINKPSQSNGVTHGGGQRCSSGSGSPCAQIRQWWAIEFAR